MGNYRIVGTFRVEDEKKNSSSGRGQSTDFAKTVNQVKKVRTVKPLDITSSYKMFQPVNTFSTYSENRGMIWGHIKLASGDIWPDWDGQRLIIEASARRIIYMKNGGEGDQHIYMQAPRAFITSVTTDTFNRKAAEKTKLTKRLAEWEVHFLVGFLAAAHWVGLITVIAGDVIQQIAGEKKRNTAYREAAGDIIEVDKDLKDIAPVFRKKLLEVLIGGAKVDSGKKTATFIQTLPELMIKDDKTTGRIAGAIAAKFIFNQNNLVLFFVFQTICVQSAAKSVSKIPPALGTTFKEGYQRLAPNIEGLDPNNPNDQKMLLNHMIDTMDKLGVGVSSAEAIAINDEFKRNPRRITDNLMKLGKAFEKLSNTGEKR